MQRILYLIATAVAVVTLTAMIGLTVADVFGRNFVRPIGGASEITRILLAFLFFSGIVIVTRNDGHITVGLLYDTYPPLLKRIEHMVTGIATFLATCFLAWMMFDQGMRLLRSGALTDYFDWPYAPFVFGLAAVTALSVVFAFLSMIGRSATDPHKEH